MRKIWIAVCVVCLVALVACTSKDNKEATKQEKVQLSVLAAASMSDAMDEITDEYTKKNPNVTFVNNYDSSGTLQTQIENGAPADVFVSAAQKQMKALQDQDLMDTDSVFDLLENKVVLIKQKGADVNITSFEEVATDALDLVAIGNSDVPVGQYTQMIYEHLGLWEQIKSKANYATNVRQVLDWVASGNVKVGVVYATDAAIEPKVEIISETPKGSIDQVLYPVGVLKASKHKKEAQDFVGFLQSNKVTEILETYGFSPIQK